MPDSQQRPDGRPDGVPAVDSFTALYGQVQVLTDRLHRMESDLATLRDTAAPQAQVEQFAADVAAMRDTIRAIQTALDDLTRGDDRRKNRWDNLTKIVVAALTGGGLVYAIQALAGQLFGS